MVSELGRRLCDNIEKVMIGKTEQIRLCLAALLCGGHVLLEDVPGTGKTVLCKTLARSLGGSFARIQFTPDLLPTELMGLSVFHPGKGEFSFRQGSLFANIILADEINRATPRTQSGLLESMEERTVSVDGKTYTLPEPYFVIATQNPVETQGTFPLPEAQLDRFLIRLSLGYPGHTDSENILRRFLSGASLPETTPVCGMDELQKAREEVRGVYLHDDVAHYIVAIAEATRDNSAVALGLSTRGALALGRAAQARAALEGRDFVIPEDVKALAPHVILHRLIFRGGHAQTAADAFQKILDTVPVPVEDWKKPDANRPAASGGGLL